MAAFIQTMLKLGPLYGSGTGTLPFAGGGQTAVPAKSDFFVHRGFRWAVFLNVENGNPKVLLSVLTI